MFYLVASLLLSALMTVSFKVAANRDLDGDPVLLCNYVLATAVSLVRTIRGGVPVAPGAGPFSFVSTSARGSLFLCIVPGLVMGWLSLATLDLSQKKHPLQRPGGDRFLQPFHLHRGTGCLSDPLA